MLGTNSYAQEDTPSAIMVRSKTDGESIKLRWAPSNPSLWWFTNQYGYKLERVTLYRDGKSIQPETKVLADTLKPLSVEEWAEVIHDSNLFGVAAQSIYGEDVTMDNNLSQVDMVTVINTVKEREMRFAFALSAADQSIRVAEYSGLYYEDHSANSNETYLYRVISNVPNHLEMAAPGVVVTGLAEVKNLPKVQEVQAQYRNGMVEVSWNQELSVFNYIGFWIERSDDKGKSFHKIHSNPIVNTFDETKISTRYLVKMDSVPLNYQTYKYRVLGVDAFGDIGPSSRVVTIKASKELTAIPIIQEVVNEDNKQVRIEWELPKDQRNLIHHQEIYRASSAEDQYIPIAKNLSNKSTHYTDVAPLQSNYYKLAYVDSSNQISYSLPYMVTMVDSIPPQIPVDFRGKVDREGKVTLQWTESPDLDVAGYSIFRANKKHEEFVLRNGKVVTTTYYLDSVSMKTLNSDIYYQIAAVDKVGNMSDKSSIIQLAKPDLIPPAPTTFKDVKSTSDGVSLTWYKSSSNDVAVYALYRKKVESSENWSLVGVRPIGDSLLWNDQSMADFESYYYTLVVMDRAKNESTPAKPVRGKRIDNKIRAAISQFSGKLDLMQKEIRLWWAYDRKDVVKYMLYRQVGDGNLRLYKELSPVDTEFIDSAIQTGVIYNYRIRAVMLDGAQSEFSKILQI
ncbi:fibronectin type III domain-containing protein [Sediminitomix flava]|nr:hypothetical protein [Sediminitomix flava]